MFFLPFSGARKPAAVIQNQAVFAWLPSAVPNSAPRRRVERLGYRLSVAWVCAAGVLAVQSTFFAERGCARGGQKQVVASASWPRDASERKGGSRSVNTLAGVKAINARSATTGT